MFMPKFILYSMTDECKNPDQFLGHDLGQGEI